jgi:hypothetical protein
MDLWRLGKALPRILERALGHRTGTDIANAANWPGYLLHDYYWLYKIDLVE